MSQGHNTMKLLGDLVASLFGDQFETLLFQWIEAHFQIDNCTVLAYPGSQAPQSLYHHSVVPAVRHQLEAHYLSGAYLLDPFYSLHTEAAASGLYTMSDVAPDQFLRTKYYDEYYNLTTMVDELVFATYPTPSTSIQISIGRDANSLRRFSKREIEAARRIAPVVCALCEKHWQDYRAKVSAGAVDVHLALRGHLKRERDITLSPRQAEVALLILKGHSSLSISLLLGISDQTVKVFRKQLYRKCGISSQAELFTMMMPILSDIVASRQSA